MTMMKLFLIWIFACNLANAGGLYSESSDYDDVHHESRLSVLPSRVSLARQKFESFYAHQQMYIGFPNDPFGPSKLQAKNSKFNSSTPLSTEIPRSKVQHSSKNVNRTEEARTKRGVIHLYNMVSCATGCNPLIYKGYGCYCGFLGSGHVVDGIDRCCKMHDWCYDKTKCPLFLGYFMPYYWMCYNKRPICAVIHGEYGNRKSCAGELCECDRKLSECLRRFPCPNSRALCRSSPLRLLQNTLMII